MLPADKPQVQSDSGTKSSALQRSSNEVFRYLGGKGQSTDFVATSAIWHVEWTSDMMFGIRKAGDKLFYKLKKNRAWKRGCLLVQCCCEDMKRSER